MKNLVIIIAAAFFLIIHSGPAAAQVGGERMFDPDPGWFSPTDLLFPEDPAERPPIFGPAPEIPSFTDLLFPEDPAELPPIFGPAPEIPSFTDFLFSDDPAELPPIFGPDSGELLGITTWMFDRLDSILHGTEPEFPPISWTGTAIGPEGEIVPVFDYMMDIWFTTSSSQWRSVNISINPGGQLQIDSHASRWEHREENR